MNWTLRRFAAALWLPRAWRNCPLSRAEDLLLCSPLGRTRLVARAGRSLVAFLSRLAPEADPLVMLAAALTSHQLGHGHVCLDLRDRSRNRTSRCRCRRKAMQVRDVAASSCSQALDGAHWCKVLAASAWSRWQPTVAMACAPAWC